MKNMHIIYLVIFAMNFFVWQIVHFSVIYGRETPIKRPNKLYIYSVNGP